MLSLYSYEATKGDKNVESVVVLIVRVNQGHQETDLPVLPLKTTS